MIALLMLACAADRVEVGYLAPLQIAPSGGATGVGTDVVPHAVFNDGLETWQGFAWIEDLTGTPVVAALDYDPEGWTLSLLPESALDADARYTLVLAAGLSGESLGPLPGEIRSGFHSAGALAGGDNTPPEAVVVSVGSCLVGQALALDGSDSFDPDGDALDFSWRVASGSAELETPESAQTALMPLGVGEVVVGLVVDDGLVRSEEVFVRLDCG